ncbi:TetR/AcrR family transcriptional regulator [Eubacterium limosum]|uniref:TetR/AcrR family transcriptional regulator n=1 Tax=Eubacterium limosum TaxID=1736 RepID=UPI00371799A9
MANNEAGIATKQKIIYYSKLLFYKNGFNKTTLKNICEAAEIPRTNLFHYFRDKTDIASFLTNDINNRFYGCVNQEIETRHYGGDLIQKGCTCIAAFFLSVMSDLKLNRFFSEIYLNHTGVIPGNDFYLSVFRTLYKAAKKNPETLEFKLFYITNTACQGEFLRQFMTGELNAPSTECVTYFLNQLLIGLSVPEENKSLVVETAIRLSGQLETSFSEVFWTEPDLKME